VRESQGLLHFDGISAAGDIPRELSTDEELRIIANNVAPYLR
jgi:hypothetical protein